MQYFRDTSVDIPAGPPAWTTILPADPLRVFFSLSSYFGSTFVIATKAIDLSAGNKGTVITQPGPPYEQWLGRHGQLVKEEWLVQVGGVINGIQVIELLEWEPVRNDGKTGLLGPALDRLANAIQRLRTKRQPPLVLPKR